MRVLTLLLTLVAAASVFGCSSGDDAATPTATPRPPLNVDELAIRGPFGVGVLTVEFVDPSRPTAPNRDYGGAASRTFPTEIWYPTLPSDAPEVADAPIDAAGGPYPLIVFAHGFSSFRRQSASYAQHLASHGYVVASPDFPGSHAAAAGGPRLYAVLDQPADVSFLVDELLQRDTEAGWPLAGALDSERIGMTGHSLGGVTAMLTAYGERADDRMDAILPISPPACYLPEDLSAKSNVPAMVVGGSSELIVNPAWIEYAYEIAGPPKYFVSIIGGDHIRFADVNATDAELPGIVDMLAEGDTTTDAREIVAALGADGSRCLDSTELGDELISGDRQRELLRTVALPFFDAYLKDDSAAAAFLNDRLTDVEGVRVRSDAGSAQGSSE